MNRIYWRIVTFIKINRSIMNKKIHYLSKIFQPLITLPKNARVTKAQEITTKTQKLLLENGLIRSTSPGCFALLPLAVRSLRKLENIIHTAMGSVDAYEVQLPTLTSSELWVKSNRLYDMHDELFKLKDRHNKEYILSPTHEESITAVLASAAPISYKQLPLLMYQMTEKHRDEKRPQGGLLRTRQFLMMDAYSFHVDEQSARQTYDRVSQAYTDIFQNVGVDYKRVRADTGSMGGTISHEWHYESPAGSDTLVACCKCGETVSRDISRDGVCDSCGSRDLRESVGIEIGHTFILGEKYSQALNATLVPPPNSQNSSLKPIFSACYGIGMTRMLTAALEMLSDSDKLVWPKALAPFSVCIIGSKEGSKESQDSRSLVERLCHDLSNHAELTDDVLVDDRCHLTIGKRTLEATRIGYPYIVIAGKMSSENVLELIDTVTGQNTKYTYPDLVNFLFGANNEMSNKCVC